MAPTRTLIFAKAPIPGFAKSRLIPALGKEGAATLARKLLLNTVNIALASDLGCVELCVTPEISHEAWRSLPIPEAVRWSEQGEGDLGVRLYRAAKRIAAAGDAMLIIGTDCPALGATQLQQAAESLSQKNAVLTPTADGGYALIGLKKVHPSIFEGIAWSTDTVAQETLGRMHFLNWSVQTFPVLHDVDVPGDLQWLPTGWPEKSYGQT